MTLRRFAVFVLPLIVWLAVIFTLSTTVGAATNTNSGLNRLLALLFPRFFHHLTWPQLDAMHFYLRKCAHVTEYAILGVLMLRAITMAAADKSKIQATALLSAWLLCAFYAATDEYHQSFVPGRSPEVKDALLDSVGAAVGILLTYAVARRRRRA